ncbi:hypothetical protein GXP67_16090 [Rhodocytophaga rosea]|uniref:DUF7619 domain-containing protein n=1 Tax=Rhodocytophaga rosea TaxID=2704465 RepID=A0A6C0GK68_9BACT|nr:gliding motility-associated C-terminal domain-containing protein [Rhodocytophaga rosea]QHT68052.1 hypothetical protein GXP67_16090 [Rhodocytophaga rosea]
MSKLSTKLFSILIFLFISSIANAQEFEWVNRFPQQANDSYYKITADGKGNVFILSTFNETITLGDSTFNSNSPSNYDDLFLAKYNSAGQILWARQFGGYGEDMSTGEDIPVSLALDNDGNCYLSGIYSGVFKLNNAIYNTRLVGAYHSESYVLKFNGDGQLAWARFLEGKNSASHKALSIDGAGNVLVAGNLWWGYTLTANGVSITPKVNEESYLVKYNKNGDLLWLKNTGGRNNSIVRDKAGFIYITGVYREGTTFDSISLNPAFYNANYVFSSFIAKCDANGRALWAKPIQGKGDIESMAINIDASGNIYVMGRYDNEVPLGQDTLRNIIDSTPNNYNAFLAQFNSTGKPMWGLKMLSPNKVISGDIVVGPTDNIYFSGTMVYRGLIGNTPFGVNYDVGNFYGKINQSGTVQWINQILRSSTYNIGNHMATDGKGNLFLAGQGGQKFGHITSYEEERSVYLTKLRDTTFITPSQIRGKVFNELNNNCKQDANEKPLANHLLKAEPGPYYASTDKDGNYQLELPKGTFQISQITQVQGLFVEQTCPANPSTYTITINSYGKDTSGFNFGNQVIPYPLLKVGIAADRRRRCFRNTTTVSYTNQGYATAQNVEVQVYFPQYVIPIDASMGFTRKDSLLTFSIGSLQPGQSGTIIIIDSVACGNESIRGLTQCVKAVITPSNTKPSDPNWDHSDITLKAVCKENGLVKLLILNSGIGSMADSASYRIYLDALQVFESKYKLPSGDSLSLQVPVNGRTIRLEADLRPYHPDAGRVPNITLEGCGSSTQVTVSKGFVDQLPQDDTEEEVSVSCLPILDSFDPNDKAVSPVGIGPSKIIAADQPLEYLIRFQNTGTDVAYTVTIIDTLDAALDIASLEVAAASHSYNWSVSGVGLPVLIFIFNNINLPDSSSNEPASHGYVRFRVRPKQATADGVKITNQAAIIFDYNSPVMTNVVSQTTGQMPTDMQQKIDIDICSGNYPTQAQAGENIILSETAQVSMQANQAIKGYGYWKLIQGKGTISNPADPTAKVMGLGAGKNIFEWRIAMCDSISKSQVTIERVVIPAKPLVIAPAPYCQREKILPIRAEGTGIQWYSDASLQEKLAEGDTYQPTSTHTDTLYMTQTIDGYQSLPTAVIISIKPEIAAPQVDPIGYVCNGHLQAPIQAIGERIKWYRDEKLTSLIQEGNTLEQGNFTEHVLFVTQTVNGCTSPASKAALQTGENDLKAKVFIPNVITPNGDGANDAFFQPQFKEGTCIGNFHSIRIYNRWGKMVYSSSDPAFAWTAQGMPTGYYYYEIRYSNFSSQGGLSVLH